MPQELNTEPLLLELGRALYVFQAIEARIKLLLPHLAPAGTEQPAPGEGWAGWRKYMDSKEMLGLLVKRLQERLVADDPATLEREWRAVVQCRNDVVHNFVFQEFARCWTEDELKKSIEYVRSRRVRALPLLQMLEAVLRGLIASLQLPPGYEGDVHVELPEWLGVSAA